MFMLILSSFLNIRLRHQRERRDRTLLPGSHPDARVRRGSCEGQQGNDAGTEHSLLDVQLSRYFRREFGDAMPPAGVLGRLLQSIAENQGGRLSRRHSRPWHLAANAYQWLLMTNLFRAANGLVAAALLVALLSTHAQQTLLSQGGAPGALAPPAASSGTAVAVRQINTLQHSAGAEPLATRSAIAERERSYDPARSGRRARNLGNDSSLEPLEQTEDTGRHSGF